MRAESKTIEVERGSILACAVYFFKHHQKRFTH